MLIANVFQSFLTIHCFDKCIKVIILSISSNLHTFRFLRWNIVVSIQDTVTFKICKGVNSGSPPCYNVFALQANVILSVISCLLTLP